MRYKLHSFFKEFLSRNGSHIFIATISARILSFLSSWIALQFIPNFELGLVIYALNIISLVSPISGMGASQGLLRFGALSDSAKEKNNLFIYVLKKGTLFTFLLISLIILGSSFITSGLKEARPALIILAFMFYSGMDILIYHFIEISTLINNSYEHLGFLGIILFDILNTDQLEWWASFLCA